MAKRRRSTGQTIGSILVGFDHQVFRATKPPAELVESAKPLPTVSGRDGSLLSITLSDVEPPPAFEPDADRAKHAAD